MTLKGFAQGALGGTQALGRFQLQLGFYICVLFIIIFSITPLNDS